MDLFFAKSGPLCVPAVNALRWDQGHPNIYVTKYVTTGLLRRYYFLNSQSDPLKLPATGGVLW